MRAFAAASALLLASAAAAFADCPSCTEPQTLGQGEWHLLIEKEYPSSGGCYSVSGGRCYPVSGADTFQLIRGLSREECDFMAARALGLPATAEEKAKAKKEADERTAKYAADKARGEKLCKKATKEDQRLEESDGFAAYCYGNGKLISVDYGDAGISVGMVVSNFSSGGVTKLAECFK